ncbi:MAG: hypothetical protein OXQ29_24990 [Rhodospirillaceae bacterium]|nr:hypothetical protein [Rhodospirillaceae bacterium]
MDHEGIIERWKEAVSTIADSQRSTDREAARRRIRAINQEWKRRRDNPDFFVWPSTDASPGDGPFAIDPPDTGMLSHLGYRVGRSGRPRRARQRLLLEMFSSELPPLNSMSYMDEWCAPRSSGRLRKLAYTLAALARNAKRRDDNAMRHAIADWEADLRHLHDELYVTMFGPNELDWPSTMTEW